MTTGKTPVNGSRVSGRDNDEGEARAEGPAGMPRGLPPPPTQDQMATVPPAPVDLPVAPRPVLNQPRFRRTRRPERG